MKMIYIGEMRARLCTPCLRDGAPYAGVADTEVMATPDRAALPSRADIEGQSRLRDAGITRLKCAGQRARYRWRGRKPEMIWRRLKIVRRDFASSPKI